MRALYIDRYFMRDDNSCFIASVSMPILERKNIKNNLKLITNKVISFDLLNYSNVKTYYDFFNSYIKNKNMSSYVLKVHNFKRSLYCKQLLHIIKNEYNLYNKEELRVYIPFDKNKIFLKTLNAMVKKRKMKVSIEEIRYDESTFSQLANIIAGCVYYHDREDLYEVNLGKKGKPQLVAFCYSCKKTKNKLLIEDFKNY